MSWKIGRSDIAYIFGLVVLLAPSVAQMSSPSGWTWEQWWTHGGVIAAIVVAWLRQPKPKEDSVNVTPVVYWAIAASLLVPTTSSAQSLSKSADQLARQYAQVAVSTQNAPAPTVVQIPQKTWLRTFQGVYTMAMIGDGWAACNAVRQLDVNGNPINKPSNALVPDSCSKIIAEKVAIAIPALIASEKLYDQDHKFEAYATLAGTAVGFIASIMTTVYEKPDTGIYPAPVAAKAKRGIRFSVAVPLR